MDDAFWLQLSDGATCLLSTKDRTACVLLASPGSGDTPPFRQRATGVIQALYRIESGELLAPCCSYWEQSPDKVVQMHCSTLWSFRPNEATVVESQACDSTVRCTCHHTRRADLS